MRDLLSLAMIISFNPLVQQKSEKVADKKRLKNGAVDYSEDFFSKHAHLTVSGQLNVEPFCCSMSDVYTFGPTFRAEYSFTSRHLAEFWMIEPEIAYVVACARENALNVATLNPPMGCNVLQIR